MAEQARLPIKLTAADVKRQSKLLPKRTKLDEFVFKRPNPNDSDTDFETPKKKPVAPKKQPAKQRKPNNKTKKRDKRQPKIESSLLRQDLLFSEIVAQHTLAEKFNPDEIQLALALSKSEVTSDEEHDKELPDIRQQLRKFGFRTAPKEYYDEQMLNIFKISENKSKKNKTRWSSKITALTLRNAEAQQEKLQRHIESIKNQQSSSISTFFQPIPTPHYAFISENLCRLNMPDFMRIIKDENENMELEQYFVPNLFPVSHVPAGHLLKNWCKIQGRETSDNENLPDGKLYMPCSASAQMSSEEAEDELSLNSSYKPIRALSPDIFDCSVENMDLSSNEENQPSGAQAKLVNIIRTVETQDKEQRKHDLSWLDELERAKNAVVLLNEHANKESEIANDMHLYSPVNKRANTRHVSSSAETYSSVDIPMLDDDEIEEIAAIMRSDVTGKKNDIPKEDNLQKENVVSLIDDKENEEPWRTNNMHLYSPVNKRARRANARDFSSAADTNVCVDIPMLDDDEIDEIAALMRSATPVNKNDLPKEDNLQKKNVISLVDEQERSQENEHVISLIDDKENEEQEHVISLIDDKENEKQKRSQDKEHVISLIDDKENEKQERSQDKEHVISLIDDEEPERSEIMPPSKKRAKKTLQDIATDPLLLRLEHEMKRRVLLSASQNNSSIPTNKSNNHEEEVPHKAKKSKSCNILETSSQSCATIDLTQEEFTQQTSSNDELIILSDDEVNYSTMQDGQQSHNLEQNTNILDCPEQPTMGVEYRKSIHDDSLSQSLSRAAALPACSSQPSVEERVEKDAFNELEVNGVTYVMRESNSPEPTCEILSPTKKRAKKTLQDMATDTLLLRLEHEMKRRVLLSASQNNLSIPTHKSNTHEEEVPHKAKKSKSCNILETSSQSCGTIDLTQEEFTQQTSSNDELIILSDDEVNYSTIQAQQMDGQQSHNLEQNTNILDCPEQPTISVEYRKSIHDDSLSQALAMAAALPACSPEPTVVETVEKDVLNELEVNGVTYLMRESNSPEPTYESYSDAQLQQELDNFGIKSLKRHQAIKILDYTYRITHPYLVEEPQTTQSEPPQKSKEPQKEQKVDLTDSFVGFMTQAEQIQYTTLLQAEKYIFQTNITKKTPRPLLPLHLAFANLVAANAHLYERILMYKPLDVESIYNFFKNMGIRYDPKQIREFLDRRSIVFRYETSSGSEKKPRVAKNRRNKK